MLGMRWAGVDFRWCSARWARAGWGGRGRAGQGRHCIEDESSNNSSRIVGQTQPTPFPLCIPRHHLPAAQPNNCPSLVPTPWIVYRCRHFSHPPLPCPDRTAMASVRSQLLWLVQASGPAQMGPPIQDSAAQSSYNRQYSRTGQYWCWITQHAAGAAGTRNLQCLQSLGYHSCTSCCSWAPSSRYAAALSAVGHARHWPTSRSCRYVHSGPALPVQPVRLFGRGTYYPFLVLNIFTSARRGPKPLCAPSTAPKKEYIIPPCSVGFLVSGPRMRCFPAGQTCSLDQRRRPRPIGAGRGCH